MKLLFSNNAETFLVGQHTAGSATLTLSDAAKFPSPAASEGFYVRLGTDALNEVVLCTAKSGNNLSVAPTTLTWAAGTQVIGTVSAELLRKLHQRDDDDKSYGAGWAGSPITTPAVKVPRIIQRDCTITRVTLLTDGAVGSCVVDIQKGAAGVFPSASSICGSTKPALANASIYDGVPGASWTKNLSEGDILTFILESSSTFKLVTVELGVTPR